MSEVDKVFMVLGGLSMMFCGMALFILGIVAIARGQ